MARVPKERRGRLRRGVDCCRRRITALCVYRDALRTCPSGTRRVPLVHLRHPMAWRRRSSARLSPERNPSVNERSAATLYYFLSLSHFLVRLPKLFITPFLLSQPPQLPSLLFRASHLSSRTRLQCKVPIHKHLTRYKTNVTNKQQVSRQVKTGRRIQTTQFCATG